MAKQKYLIFFTKSGGIGLHCAGGDDGDDGDDCDNDEGDDDIDNGDGGFCGGIIGHICCCQDSHTKPGS